MADESAETLAGRILKFSIMVARDPSYAATHPGEAAAAIAAAVLLTVTMPELVKLPQAEAAKKVHSLASKHLLGANAPTGQREQSRTYLIQEMMSSLKLMGEILSNVSKTRSEISATFARNARA